MAENEKNIVSGAKKKRGKKSGLIVGILATVLVLTLIFFFVPVAKGNNGGARKTLFSALSSGSETVEKTIMTSKPFISTIELTVSGSGTVEPLDRYEIVSLVSGDVISAPYEEGDLVKEDDVVYVIDHEEQDKNIESARNSITKSKIRNKIYLDEEEFNKTLAKYTVRAEEDGIISDFDLEADDKVSANSKLGVIQNLDKIIATVPFNAAQFEKISEGDKAMVYLYPSMYTKEGTVTYKSYKATASVGGAVAYDVEITFDGSNITLTDTSASAGVITDAGTLDSLASGSLKYPNPVNIFAEVSGDVLSVSEGIKNGARVKKGDILFTIDSDEFLESKTLAEFDFHDLELNLENAIDRLDNYNIKSPISGTVISKNLKKGDTVSSGNNGNTLMVIADMSAMKFTFQADETDIEKIKVGQDVIVTADAVTGKRFIGRVESVATEGTSSNGVSYYEVEVVIDNYGQNDESGVLRSGMNVSAEIVYEKAENALCLPVSAVTSMGGDSYVFVKGSNKTNEATKENPVNKEPGDKKPGMGEKQPSENKEPQAMNGDEGMPGKDAENNRNEAIKQRIADMTPEGFTAVKVTTGSTDGTRIAILTGISPEDEVYIAENDNVQAPVSSGGQMGLSGGMMGGGMMGGMRPSGNMGAMRPSGGMMGGMSGGMRR